MIARDPRIDPPRSCICRRAAWIGCVLLPLATQAAAQPQTGTLAIVVLDPSGASIPHARISVVPLAANPEAAVSGETVGPPATHVDGVFVVASVPAGTYRVVVRAQGFETTELTGIRIRPARETRQRVRLQIARLAESVAVERDPQTVSLDPRGFSTFLSREQIDALPDDPVEMARVLQELAPPGAVVRVDGFTGAPLPPKSQILSIRLPRLDTFSAQEHGGLSGIAFIDIVTRPGGGQLQGSIESTFRDGSLNARNPLAGGRGPESVRTGGVALDGPVLPDRLSFSFAMRGGRVNETATVHAALPDGTLRHDPVPRPQEGFTMSGRLAAALPASQTARVSFSSDRRRSRNLGAGDYNLPERGYTASSSDAAVRVAIGGPIGRRSFLESRVQLRWTGVRNLSNTEARTERVLDAFSSGGAQVTGGARSMQWLAAADFDHARGVHAWRAGVLVEAGRHRVNRRANYLGTYTFASLDDYAAGRPATFTRRVGDARVAYGAAEVGIYAQDDYRLARSLLLSYGIRYERQAIVQGSSALMPRVALAWSPSRAGRTTVRAAWGRFADWLATSTYEQSLLVDGTRQYDVQLVNPAYPDPGPGGESGPRERYLLPGTLALPRGTGLSLGAEHQASGSLRLSASYVYRTGRGLLRGENLNAPENGLRPDPAWGNVVRARNDAGSRTHSVTMQFQRSSGRGRVSAAGSYVFTAGGTNTIGPFAVPAAEDVGAEWGPSVPSHLAAGTATARITDRLSFTITPRWRSGIPYTITTGRDDNGDGLFVDRPPGTPRNGARTPPHWEVDARLAYVWRFGPLRGAGGGISSAGGDAQSTRAGSVASGQGGPDAFTRGKYRVEVFAAAQNATNRTNVVAVSGVLQSPLFGTPVSAINPRRFDFGIRFGF